MSINEIQFGDKTFTPHHFKGEGLEHSNPSSEAPSLEILHMIKVAGWKWWGVLMFVAKFLSFAMLTR